MGKHPGKRQFIVDSKGGANGSLAITERVPCHTNSRLEVEKRLVFRPECLNRCLSGTGEAGQDSERVSGRSRHRDRLVAQAEVHHKRRAQTPIVLNVSCKERLTHIDRASGALIVDVDAGGLVEQETCERGEIELSIWWNPSRELVVLHVLEGETKFKRMVATSQEGIVIELVGIPSENV